MNFKNLIYILSFILLISLVSANADLTQKWEEKINISIMFNEGNLIQPESNQIFLNLNNNKFTITQSDYYLSSLQIDALELYFYELQKQNLTLENISNELINSVALRIVENLELGVLPPEEDIKIVESQYKLESEIFSNKGLILKITLYIMPVLFLIAFLLTRVHHKTSKQEDKFAQFIRDYIKINLEKGYDLSNIKVALVRQGYDQNLVEEVTKKYFDE